MHISEKKCAALKEENCGLVLTLHKYQGEAQAWGGVQIAAIAIEMIRELTI